MKIAAKDITTNHVIDRESLFRALEKYGLTKGVFDSDFSMPYSPYLTVSSCAVENNLMVIEVDGGFAAGYALGLDDELEVYDTPITYDDIYNLLTTYSQEQLEEVADFDVLMYRVRQARIN